MRKLTCGIKCITASPINTDTPRAISPIIRYGNHGLPVMGPVKIPATAHITINVMAIIVATQARFKRILSDHTKNDALI